MSNTDTRIFPFSIAAGGVLPLHVAGYKFLVRDTSGPVNVRWQGGYLSNLDSGQGYNVRSGFDRLTLTNDGAGTIAGSIQIADDDFIDNRLTGSITGVVTVAAPAVLSNSLKTVNTAASSVITGNADRLYLLVQNNHPTATIWLNFSAIATVLNGLKIVPGGYFEMTYRVHTGSVSMIADATNDKVLVVTG